MKKITTAAVLGAATMAAFTLSMHTAEAQIRPSPKPILQLLPQFSCAATVSGLTGSAIIKKTNNAAVDATKDVVAVVQTPNGKVTAALCGSSFASTTQASAPFTLTSTNKDWIYTCSASQTTTTAACNPPK